MEKKLFKLSLICSILYLLLSLVFSVIIHYWKYLKESNVRISIKNCISLFQLTSLIDVTLVFSLTFFLSLGLNNRQPQYIKHGLFFKCILFIFFYLILDYLCTYFVINNFDIYLHNKLYYTNDFLNYIIRVLYFFFNIIVLFITMLICFYCLFFKIGIKFTHIYIDNDIIKKINALSYSLLTSAILLNYISINFYSHSINLADIIKNFLYESTLLSVAAYLFFFVNIIIFNLIAISNLPFKLTQFYPKNILFGSLLSTFIIIAINDPLITILLPKLYTYSLDSSPSIFIVASLFCLIIFWIILFLPFFSCSFSIRYFFAKLT